MTHINKNILTLSMMKMEKNFIGVNEKGYSRYPYEDYPIWNDEDPNMSLIAFVNREMIELVQAIHNMKNDKIGYGKYRKRVLEEIADVSNVLDFLYEAVLRDCI